MRLGDISWPRPLRPGDRAVILSPAGKPSVEEVEQGRALLQTWGLQVDDYEPREPEWVFAASDSERAEAVQHAFDDDGVQAILCSRGGYGSQRIVDEVDPAAFVAR